MKTYFLFSGSVRFLAEFRNPVSVMCGHSEKAIPCPVRLPFQPTQKSRHHAIAGSISYSLCFPAARRGAVSERSVLSVREYRNLRQQRRCGKKNEYYSIISVTTPEPTVLPPSLIANLSPSSIAIGVMSSMFITTLSPGMHISVPSGS